MTQSATAAVRLHRALYMQQAIKEAMQTFADFAAFKLVRDGEHYVVTVSDIDPDADGDVVAEFSNFALHNTMLRKKKRI